MHLSPGHEARATGLEPQMNGRQRGQAFYFVVFSFFPIPFRKSRDTLPISVLVEFRGQLTYICLDLRKPASASKPSYVALD